MIKIIFIIRENRKIYIIIFCEIVTWIQLIILYQKIFILNYFMLKKISLDCYWYDISIIIPIHYIKYIYNEKYTLNNI